MTYEQLSKIAGESGFTAWAPLDVNTIELKPEVRDMCAVNTCGRYGKCWSCPPGCGTLEEAAAKAARYHRGVLLQTTAQLEDDFDIEAMQQAEVDQKQSFLAFVEQLRQEYPDCLPMATGGCTLCPQCTYPDAPCRFPKKAIPSMEAYGLLVSKVCEKSGLPYYYGPQTLTYTSCVLID